MASRRERPSAVDDPAAVDPAGAALGVEGAAHHEIGVLGEQLGRRLRGHQRAADADGLDADHQRPAGGPVAGRDGLDDLDRGDRVGFGAPEAAGAQSRYRPALGQGPHHHLGDVALRFGLVGVLAHERLQRLRCLDRAQVGRRCHHSPSVAAARRAASMTRRSYSGRRPPVSTGPAGGDRCGSDTAPLDVDDESSSEAGAPVLGRADVCPADRRVADPP